MTFGWGAKERRPPLQPEVAGLSCPWVRCLRSGQSRCLGFATPIGRRLYGARGPFPTRKEPYFRITISAALACTG